MMAIPPIAVPDSRPFEPTHFKDLQGYETRKQGDTDPTTLIVIDEAGRIYGVWLLVSEASRL